MPVPEPLDEVRQAASALSDLVDQTGALWPKVSIALRATCEDVERRLAHTEVVVPILGTTAQKRALLDAIVGERLFAADTDAAPPPITITVRRGAMLRFVARRSDGSPIEPEPDRTAQLDATIQKLEAEAEAASALATSLRRELAALRNSERPPAPSVDIDVEEDPPPPPVEPRGFFAWLASLVSAILVALRLKKPAASLPEAVDEEPVFDASSREPGPSTERRRAFRLDMGSSVTRRLAEADATMATSRAAADELRALRADDIAKRRAVIVERIRELVSRKTDVEEIEIEHPAPALPSGMVLLDNPQLSFGTNEERAAAFRRMRRDLGGCILASSSALDDRQLGERLRPMIPYAVTPSDDVTTALWRIRRESPTVKAALAIDDLRTRVRSLADASIAAEGECRARIGTLERERTSTPEAFRVERFAAMGPSLDKAGERVVEHGLAALHERLVALGEEWTAAIQSTVDRASAEAAIKTINESAPSRLAAIVDEASAAMSAELQATSDRLESWLLDEMSVRYKCQSAQLEGTTVVTSDVSSELGSVRRIPLAAVVDTFEHKRVGIGLGGVAAGAAIGTLVFPGIGTAVGAFVGVFAGFLEGVDTLKTDGVEKVRAHVASVESEARERMMAAREEFAADLRSSLDEALTNAFERKKDWVTKLLDDERMAIAKETQRLDLVSELRQALETRSGDLAALASDVTKALSELGLGRAKPGTRARSDASLSA